MKEYDRFEKGAANSNISTTILKRQLEDPDAHHYYYNSETGYFYKKESGT